MNSKTDKKSRSCDDIAIELGLEYSIEEYDLNEMLESIAQGKADVGISCLSKTHEREKIIDFSHSFYSRDLGNYYCHCLISCLSKT